MGAQQASAFYKRRQYKQTSHISEETLEHSMKPSHTSLKLSASSDLLAVPHEYTQCPTQDISLTLLTENFPLRYGSNEATRRAPCPLSLCLASTAIQCELHGATVSLLLGDDGTTLRHCTAEEDEHDARVVRTHDRRTET